MNKKFVAIILSILIVFVNICPINIFAKDEIVDGEIKVNDNLSYAVIDYEVDINKSDNLSKGSIYEDFKYNVLGDNTVEITDYTGELEELTIPNEINGYSVTKIGSKAFYGCELLKKVTLLEGINTIGSYAFYDCLSLNSIYLPNSLKVIEKSAFYFCESLSSINIPKGIERIEDYTFYACGALKNIEIPSSVKSIGEHSFGACEALNNINIPNSVIDIGEYAFEFCSLLKSITIPNSVISISDSAFEDCNSSFFMYVIKDSYAETYCKDNLQKMVIIDKQNAKSLNYVCTVSSNDELTICKYIGMESNVIVPSAIGRFNVVSIDNEAFKGNELLNSIVIPNVVQKIGDFAFMNCSSLESIMIPSSVNGIGNNAFNNCNSNLVLSVIGESYAEKYCKDNNVSFKNYVEVSSIEFNDALITLLKGKKRTVNVKIFPNDATNKILEWNSSNTNVANVNENGIINAIGIGNAIITAKATDSSGIIATISIKVVQPVTSINLNAKSKTLAINKTFTLKATVLPKNAYNKNVLLVSSNKKVATVNSKGKIIPKGVGKTIITATAKDGSGKKAKAAITITPAKVIGVKVKAGKKKVIISFKKAKGAKKYEIYRSFKKNKGFKKVKTTTGRKWTNKKLKSKKTYYYRVKAVNGKYKGEFSVVRKGKVK